VIDVGPDRFAALAQAALAELPPELAGRLDNVALFIEDEPPTEDPGLLGYYEGIPQTERDSMYGGVLPDRIVLFRHSILEGCDTQAEVVREVGITVAHEIAHHFGIDDDRLHALGYA
jgi:predicted Zn-dependent protease with MMP-like domain